MRSRQIEISILNIVLGSPHARDRYISLLRQAYSLRKPIGLRGDWVAMLGSCRVEKRKSDAYVRGELFRYFDLARDTDWFNIRSRRPADDEEIDKIQIPANLKPHFQIFDYVFFPASHRLGVVTADGKTRISARQVRKLLTGLFKDPRITEKFGTVDVTIEPSRQALEQILKLPRLQRLRIDVSPPNPDDLQEAEKRLFEKLNNQRADRFAAELVSNDKQGLAPDSDTRELAEIAQSNGEVFGHGSDADGVTVDISTKDHPYVGKTRYIPDQELRSAVLMQKTLEILKTILK